MAEIDAVAEEERLAREGLQWKEAFFGLEYTASSNWHPRCCSSSSGLNGLTKIIPNRFCVWNGYIVLYRWGIS